MGVKEIFLRFDINYIKIIASDHVDWVMASEKVEMCKFLSTVSKMMWFFRSINVDVRAVFSFRPSIACIAEVRRFSPVSRQFAARSFESLVEADLQEVYEQTKQEALRDYAFRVKLESTDTLEKLRKLVFDDTAVHYRWNALELLEISNRFRLFDAPEFEVLLYEETGNAELRGIPRAREFYLLALNKVGRTAEAIDECKRIIAQGGGNGLVCGILGDSYSDRMEIAEKFATALKQAEGNSTCVDEISKDEFVLQFPLLDVDSVTFDEVHSLRRQLLGESIRAYRQGFEQFGTAFPGLCWMIRTLDEYTDLLEERACLREHRQSGSLGQQSGDPLGRIETEVRSLERLMNAQPLLLHVALELEGGRESLDFWPHSGELQLAFTRGCDIVEVQPILARVFTTLDAEFKLEISLDDLTRIREQHARIVEIKRREGRETQEEERLLERMGIVLSELVAGQDRFVASGKTRGSALNGFYRELAESASSNAKDLFLKRTVNFHALINNLVPQYVPGGIGRVGARVPDLTVNRNVQEDLHEIVTEKVLRALPNGEPWQPRDVIDVIQGLVGERLGLSELQDLQSPAHRGFDARSEGLILLSGIEPAMRIGSRTITDLTAVLLLRTGDCRETMYLNGALYACYQKIRVLDKIREAMECLERDDMERLKHITDVDIPAILRWQLRGGHVAVYVEGISVRNKYHVERLSEDDSTASERQYGVAEFRAGVPLSRYELENSKLMVSYADGSVIVVEPRDPSTGKWRPIENLAVPGGGIPRIPKTGARGGGIADIRLLNLVEEHTMSFLYDGETGDVELCDGFYNQRLFLSPYRFESGCLDISGLLEHHGLIRAGTRLVRSSDERIANRQVYIEFLPHSTTDHAPALGEGDLTGVFRLMGRLFEGKLCEERRRLEDGTSVVPVVLEKVRAWQHVMGDTARQGQAFDQRFARVLIELARDRPELVKLHDVKRDQPLITQGCESDSVYLVLSGKFHIFQDGKLLMKNDEPITAPPGTILGEISVLRDCLPTATVVGDGVVLRIARNEFQRQMVINPLFYESVEELVRMRLELDRSRRERSGDVGGL